MFTIILCSYIDAIFVLFNNQYTTVYITYNGNNGAMEQWMMTEENIWTVMV